MTVFQDIYNYIFTSDLNLEIYGEHAYKLKDFLNAPFDNEGETAKKLFDHIGESYSKGNTEMPGGLFQLLQKMNLYEVGMGEILPGLRDHYIHSASVYALGLAIFNHCAPIREAIYSFIDSTNLTVNTGLNWDSFAFRWSLAACMHDIAYPLHLSLRAFDEFVQRMNTVGNTNANQPTGSLIRINPDIYQVINRLPLLTERNDFDLILPALRKETGLELIASSLASTDHILAYEELLEEFNRYINNDLREGKIDHGVFSALIVLYQVHSLYVENEWYRKYFYRDVLDACSAIFLHTTRERINVLHSMDVDNPSPLGYLLAVSDTLCEWLRNKSNNKEGEPSLFKIEINDHSITCTVDDKYSRKKKLIDESKFFDQGRVKINVR